MNSHSNRTVALACALALLALAWPHVPASAAQHAVPPGTRATLALRGWLSSKDAQPGDTFEATLVEDIQVEGNVVVPRGAVFVGRVAEVEHARKLSRGGKLVLVVDKLVNGEGDAAPAPGTVVAIEQGEDLQGGGKKGKKALIGGGVGGVLGAIVGGGKGLLVGLAVGAGGAIAATKGKEVELPEGTHLQVKFDREVNVTWTWRLKDQQK